MILRLGGYPEKQLLQVVCRINFMEIILENDMRICSVEDCNKKNFATDLCSLHYQRVRFHGDVNVMKTNRYMPTNQRFDIKHEIREGSDCHWWTGALMASGYGSFRINNDRTQFSHRFAYERAFGEIPKGLLICHHCDNKLCVNPDHLFAGTQKDNMDDMYAKGRGHKARGEKNGLAKLSDEKVLEIKKMLLAGKSQTAISEIYDVSQRTIYGIKTGAIWTHVS